MKNQMNDEVIQTLTAAHKRLWESLFTVLPGLQASKGNDFWREAFLKNLTTCENAVKQTLRAESAWVEQWVKQMASKQDLPESGLGWLGQVEGMMQHWLQTQNTLWDEYFKMLKSSGKELQRPAGSRVTIKPEGVTEVSSQPQPVTDESPEPSPKPAGAISKHSEQDDLKAISGLGPALEKKLNDYGIRTYRQLAQMSEAEIERIEKALKSSGRVRKYQWVEQAKEQHFQKYNERL